MKALFFSIAICFVIFFFAALSACEPKCDPAGNVKVGEQYFTVEYRDSLGNKLIGSAWNPGNVTVKFDSTGGKVPTAMRDILNPVMDGKIAPIFYTQTFIQTNGQPNHEKMIARTYKYDYYILKDIAGTDVLRVEFELSGDDCKLYWKVLNFYLKKHNTNVFQKLEDYTGKQKVDIVIVE